MLRASGVLLLASAVANTCTASKVQRWTAQIIQVDGVTNWVTTEWDCKGCGWTFLDLVHSQPPRPSAHGLDLIRQRSAQVLAPARLAADLGSRAARPGGPYVRGVAARCAAYHRKVCKVLPAGRA
jgi:hypothetical protein